MITDFQCFPLSLQTAEITVLKTLQHKLWLQIHHNYCLGGTVIRRWTRDRKVAGLTPDQGAIKSTRSTQPSLPPE